MASVIIKYDNYSKQEEWIYEGQRALGWRESSADCGMLSWVHSERTSGWMSGWGYKRVDGRVSVLVDKQASDWTGKRVSYQASEWADERAGEWTDEPAGEWVDEQMSEQVSADRQVSGRAAAWADESEQACERKRGWRLTSKRVNDFHRFSYSATAGLRNLLTLSTPPASIDAGWTLACRWPR